MIEVFKTNVQKVSQANKIMALLLQDFPGSKINFDLHDCDKILRVEGENLMQANIISIVKEHQFNCIALD